MATSRYPRLGDGFGDRMCLFSSTLVKLLEWGMADHVEEAVRRCVASSKEDNGYVLMPTVAAFSTSLA